MKKTVLGLSVDPRCLWRILKYGMQIDVVFGDQSEEGFAFVGDSKKISAIYVPAEREARQLGPEEYTSVLLDELEKCGVVPGDNFLLDIAAPLSSSFFKRFACGKIRRINPAFFPGSPGEVAMKRAVLGADPEKHTEFKFEVLALNEEGEPAGPGDLRRVPILRHDARYLDALRRRAYNSVLERW